MFKVIISASVLSLCLSFNASACDDKPCEKAYLAETKQHIANHVRHAESFKVERHAHAKNRERRAYALYRHIHLVLFGKVDMGIGSGLSQGQGAA